MQAIILAAGKGSRLGKLTQNACKCMIEVNGVSLIERLLGQLYGKVDKVHIVTGYNENILKNHIASIKKKPKIHYISNADYDTTNNIVSLWKARRILESDDCLLFESDLILEDSIVDDLISYDTDSVLVALDRYKNYMDGTVCRIDNQGRIIQFLGKNEFKDTEVWGYYKTLNIYKFKKEFSKEKFNPVLNAWVKVNPNDYYEVVLKLITMSGTYPNLLLSGGKWYEIDDQADLDTAEGLFGSHEDMIHRYGGYWRYPDLDDAGLLVNPYFPTEDMMKDMQQMAPELIRSYGSSNKICSKLAASMLNCDPKYLTVGNGASELISGLINSFDGNTVIVRKPSFLEYENRARMAGKNIIFLPWDYDQGMMMRYLSQHCSAGSVPQMLILVNPDNPSGKSFSKDFLLRILDHAKAHLPYLTVVIDESFIDFDSFGETLIEDEVLEEYDNLIVIKSFGKSYGVPGLRLGVVATKNGVIHDKLKLHSSIWNINSQAEYFMQIFKKYEKDYKAAVKWIQEQRIDDLAKINQIEELSALPSYANFITIRIEGKRKDGNDITAKEICDHLYEEGFLVKDTTDKFGFESIRIAIGSYDQSIINRIENYLAQVRKSHETKLMID